MPSSEGIRKRGTSFHEEGHASSHQCFVIVRRSPVILFFHFQATLPDET
jgi:hypothetical protein